MTEQIARMARPRHELPKLPYALDALAPYVSREALEYHYGKHHRGYVSKLNELIAGTAFEASDLSEIVRQASGPIFNNAAQVWNHTFYFNCMSPKGGKPPVGDLSKAIDECFGSFDILETQFKSHAMAKFGSGWIWLVKDGGGRLAILDSDNADNPLRRNKIPLLACDVWEHAYYIDYRSDRPQYIAAFWRLVNWEFVARNLRDGVK